jgi:amino acid adenylation domain-containing protein
MYDDIREKLSKLSRDKRKAFFQKAYEAGLCLTDIPVIKQPRDKDSYALSPAQVRMWIAENLSNDPAMHNISMGLRIRGNLQVEILTQVINNIIERHEGLKIAIKIIDDIPKQVINNQLSVNIPIIDLFKLSLAEAENELQIISHDDAILRFNLEEAPLFRIKIVKMPGNDTIFLFTIHHIIADAWSIGVFIEEVMECYRNKIKDITINSPIHDIQYIDYSEWQNEFIGSQYLKNEIDFWKRIYSVEYPKINLFQEKNRPEIQTYFGDIYYALIPDELMTKVKIFSRENDLSEFMLYLVCWKVLIYLYTNNTKIITGTVTAGRNKNEFEKIIGLFLNTLAIPCDINNEFTFHDLLLQIQNNCIEAYKNQNISFSEILKYTNLKRDKKYPFLFQHMLVYLNIPFPEMIIDDLSIEPYDRYNDVATMDMTLVFKPMKNSLKVDISYNKDIFSRDNIGLIFSQYKNVIEKLIENKHLKLNSIRDFINPQTINQYFEKAAGLYSDNIAVIENNNKYTYKELHRFSNYIGSLIQKNKIINNYNAIAILLPRSFETIVAILSVLKAGHCFVYLNPNYPLNKQREIISQLSINLILTNTEYKSSVRELDTETILLDEMMKETDFSCLPVSLANPESLAYIMFTSGSMGISKPIMMPHKSVCAYIHSLAKRISICDDDKYLHWASFSFSSSIRQLFLPLFHGASIVIADDQSIGDPERISALINDNLVTCIDTVPSFYWSYINYFKSRTVLDYSKHHVCIHSIISSGEMLDWALVNQIHSFFGTNKKFFNIYGQTESIGVSVYDIPCANIPLSGRVPIGFPLDCVKIRIIDENGNAVNDSSVGEIEVSGFTLARGYVSNNSNNIFIDSQQGQFYRTGDLAILRNDGIYETVGRNDLQIKIRGQRVDLMEIDKTVGNFPKIDRVITIARKKEKNSDKKIYCYIMSKDNNIDLNALRKYVLSILPDYMCPDYFIYLETIPVTDSGKINFHLLPEPKFIQTKNISTYEKIVLEIWKFVLKIDVTDINENFYYVGGNSLNSLQLFDILRLLGIEITIYDIRKFPTIRSQAKLLEPLFISTLSKLNLIFREIRGLEPNKIVSNQISKNTTIQVNGFNYQDFISFRTHIILSGYKIFDELYSKNITYLSLVDEKLDFLLPFLEEKNKIIPPGIPLLIKKENLKVESLENIIEQFFGLFPVGIATITACLCAYDILDSDNLNSPDILIDFSDNKAVHINIPIKINVSMHRQEILVTCSSNDEKYIDKFINEVNNFSGFNHKILCPTEVSSDEVNKIANKYSSIAEICPLLPAQHAILLNNLKNKHNANKNYFQQSIIKFSAALNSNDFISVWSELIAEIPMLRASVISEDISTSLYLIHNSLPLPLIQEDWRNLSTESQEIRLKFFLMQDRQMYFDLNNGPLFRLTLIRVKNKKYILVFTYHHIILDGWSKNILLNKFCQKYLRNTNGSNDRHEIIPAMTHYYQQIMQRNLECFKEFWRESLKESFHSACIDPKNLIRKAIEKNEYKIDRLTSNKDLLHKIENAAKKFNCSVFSLAVLACAITIYHITGNRKVLFGLVTNGRNHNGFDNLNLIGCFVNTLPFFLEIKSEFDMENLIYENQTKLDNYNKNCYFSLMEMQEIFSTSGNSSFFELLFQYDDQRLWGKGPGYPIIKSSELVYGETEFPIELNLSVKNNLQLTIRHQNSDIISVISTNILKHYFSVLELICKADKKTLLNNIPRLTNAEKNYLFKLNDNTNTDFPLDIAFIDLFQNQCQKTPNNIAVEGEQTYTYSQLNTAANKIANYLFRIGINPEDIIGVLTERSAIFLIAILAIFKVRAAYLPLDYKFSSDRLNKILSQSNTRFILVDKKNKAVIDILNNYQERFFVLEDILINENKTQNLALASNPNDLAYIIFTSGSTGAPKGAMVETKGMVNHMYCKIKDMELSNKDCVAQTATQMFDISVWQFLAILVVGGKVRIYSDDIILEPLKLLNQCISDNVTILEIVPSFLRLILLLFEDQNIASLELSYLRWLVVTGEALPKVLCEKWLSLYPDVPLMNAYGPTECSDDITHYKVIDHNCLKTDIVPIGKAVANMSLYVLDDSLNLVPYGMEGELCVSGVGVGRGYINDEVKTKMVFPEDPYSISANQRMYRTGDIVRYSINGNLIFLGRKDYQVKIRGYRIELGEIEFVLEKMDEVSQAIVKVQDNSHTEVPDLVAYLTMKQGFCENMAEGEKIDFIRKKISKILPSYMCPSAYQVMHAFPLTFNGKIDRKLLPSVNIGEALIKETDSPQLLTATQDIIMKMWIESLKLNKISIDDNFFELGGHSLILILLHNKLNQALNKDYPIQVFFQYQTIRELSNFIDK